MQIIVPTRSPADLLFRTAGATILALTLLPLHRLLDRPETGLIAQGLLQSVGRESTRLWIGTGLLVVAAAILVRLVPAERMRAIPRRAAGLLEWPSERAFPWVLALAAAGVTAALNILVFRGRPNLLDAGAQLIHARYIAAGRLAGPDAATMEGGLWYFPNMVFAPEGWVSHFPPGHSFVLAPALALGLPVLAPLLLAGGSALLTTLLVRELLPGGGLQPRVAALLGALSPLLLFQTATYMNHATAALLGVATVLAALRARRGPWPWALLAGAGVTALVAVRPLTAVATCLVVVLLAWLPGFRERTRKWHWLAARCAAATAGGLPLLVAHGAWNRHFFGSSTTFGYNWSFGEAAGLGFGIDPWGNLFGPLEALALVSADLTTLNLNLLELPLPVVSLIGLALLLGAASGWQQRLLAGWVLLPAFLSLFYWHHGYFMGPRMVSEFAPAWGILAALSLGHLLGRLPEGDRASGSGSGETGRDSERSVARTKARGRRARRNREAKVSASQGGWNLLPTRRTGEFVLLLAAMGGIGMGTFRAASLGGSLGEPFRMAEPPAPEGSLVLVRGSWISRINADMISHGVPQIVMETALRQNSTCLVHEHRRAFHRGEGAFSPYRGLEGWGERNVPEEVTRGVFPGDLPPLDLIRRPPPYRNLIRGEVGQGSPIWYHPDERLTDDCIREIESEERGGRIDAGFLLWLGELPEIERGRTMYAREMGPDANARLLERYPERGAWVLLTRELGAEPELVPYDEAMALVWEAER